ncbi:MAG: uroporphyrinogen-III synthase [Candidatus Omnitrophota bacterium]
MTRPKGQDSFAKLLERKGAEVVSLPSSEIVPLGQAGEFAAYFSSLDRYDWCFFNSVNGVRIFLSHCKNDPHSRRALKRMKFAAIGPKTKEALHKTGFTVSLIPKTFTQEGLVERIRERKLDFHGKKVLLIHAEGSRRYLSRSLKRMGASITVLHLYAARRFLVPTGFIRNAFRNREIDLVTFTSASCVDHFFSLFPNIAPRSLVHDSLIASIGPVTTQQCRSRGLRASIEAKCHTCEGLLEAIVKHYRSLEK